jgi:hypothetical protein
MNECAFEKEATVVTVRDKRLRGDGRRRRVLSTAGPVTIVAMLVTISSCSHSSSRDDAFDNFSNWLSTIDRLLPSDEQLIATPPPGFDPDPDADGNGPVPPGVVEPDHSTVTTPGFEAGWTRAWLSETEGPSSSATRRARLRISVVEHTSPATATPRDPLTSGETHFTVDAIPGAIGYTPNPLDVSFVQFQVNRYTVIGSYETTATNSDLAPLITLTTEQYRALQQPPGN